MPRIHPLAVLLFLATSASAQTRFWVDATTGNDANPGTQALPFKSITKGVATGTKDTVIHVQPGTYSPTKTGEVFTIVFGGGASNVKLLGVHARLCILDFEQVIASQNAWYFLIDTGAQDIEIAHLTMKNGAFQPTVPWYSAAIWWRNNNGLNLHHCIIESCESGIYSADGAQNVNVHDNVFLGCNIPARFRQDAAKGAKDCRFFNNLVANSTGGYSDTVSPSGADPTQVFVNNLIVDNKGDGFAGSFPAGMILENNNAFNNGGTNYNFGTTTVPASNISLDPLLVDLANGDYRLKANSPCIEAGYAVGQPDMVNDFFGNARASDFDGNGFALPDIGVHEVPGLSLAVTNFGQGQTALFALTPQQPGVSIGYLYLSALPASYTVSPIGSIGLDLPTSFFISGSAVPGTVPLVIPKLPILDGAAVYFQAFGVAANLTWRPSGRLDLRL